MSLSLERKSLVLITVDCLRADHCGFYGYSRPTTPFLDTLAQESFVVPTAVIAGAPTYYSFPAILASRMPLALGRDVVGLAPGENTLATALRDAGYATGAFSAANPYLSRRFGYDQGFEVFEDSLEFVPPSAAAQDERRSSDIPGARGELNRFLKSAAHAFGLGRFYDDLYFQYCVRIAAPAVDSVDALRKFPAAHAIIDQAISWLTTAARRPFFLWLHLMDPHSPYYPPAAAFRELTGKDLSASRARYLNEFGNGSHSKGSAPSTKERICHRVVRRCHSLHGHASGEAYRLSEALGSLGQLHLRFDGGPREGFSITAARCSKPGFRWKPCSRPASSTSSPPSPTASS